MHRCPIDEKRLKKLVFPLITRFGRRLSMKTKFHHVQICVGNLDKGREVLKDIFGWELPKTGRYSKPASSGEFRYCLVSANDVYVELVEKRARIS